MRLIDGDALVTTLKGLRALTNILSGSREMPHIPFDDMVRMIEKSPTIDPVRKGKWIDKHAGIATCSECGDRWGVHSMMKFCPSCGAKMGEGEQS